MIVWSILHDGIATADFLWRRGIVHSPNCPVCNHPIHSRLHMLRDCPSAAAVWCKLLKNEEGLIFKDIMDVSRWIAVNLYNRRKITSFGNFWPYVFRQTLHEI